MTLVGWLLIIGWVLINAVGGYVGVRAAEDTVRQWMDR